MYAWIDAHRRLNEAWLALTTRGAAWTGPDWLARWLLPAAAPPAFGLDAVTIGGERVRIEESVVDSGPFCTLRRFARRFEKSRRTPHAPVLLCAALAGHHAVIVRDTIATLLETADVYVTDWANARDVPLAAGRFGLDDDVRVIARHLRLLCDAGVHVVAICQASASALAAAALHVASGGRAPLSLTLLCGPIDTRPNPTVIGEFARAHSIDWLRRHVIDTVPPAYAGAGRRVLPGFLQQIGLMSANPQHQLALESQRWRAALSGNARAIADAQRALDAYAAVLDMDEAYFLETVEIIFKNNALAAGTYAVGAERIAFAALAQTPLFTIEAGQDRITGAAQTHAALELCRGARDAGLAPRRRATFARCGHYDVFSGPHWQRDVYPAITAFWGDVAPMQ